MEWEQLGPGCWISGNYCISRRKWTAKNWRFCVSRHGIVSGEYFAVETNLDKAKAAAQLDESEIHTKRILREREDRDLQRTLNKITEIMSDPTYAQTGGPD